MKKNKGKLSKKEFAKEITKNLNEYFNDVLDMKVTAREQKLTRANQPDCWAIVLTKENSNASPALILSKLYNRYLEGDTLDELTVSIAMGCMQALTCPPPEFMTLRKESLRERLRVRVINSERNQEYMSDVPSMEVVPEIHMICDIQVQNVQGEKWRTKVTRSLMQDMEYDPATMMEDALRNSLKNHPPVLFELRGDGDLSDNLLGEEEYRMDPDSMYILSTKDTLMGAAAMFYPGVQQRLSEMAGGNFYAIPSSVHEFIVLPERGFYDEVELQATLKSANQDLVAPEDVLSDTVYVYDAELSVMLSCREYAEFSDNECMA